LHISANRGDLRYSRNGFERVSQVPVLQAAEVSKAVAMACIDDGVFVNPARSGRVWSDDRMHLRGQSAADLLQVFENAGARPVEVCAVLKDNIDVGIAKHALRANGFHMRRG